MKSLLLPVFFMLFAYMTARACDLCGCSLNQPIHPSDNRTLAGLTYRTQWFHGHDHHTSGEVTEQYQRADLVVQFTWHRRWEFAAAMPYASYVQTSSETPDGLRLSGPGDLFFSARYALVDRHESIWKQRLSVGFGTELPTGPSQRANSEGEILYNAQPGSGAFSVLFLARYGLKKGNFGLRQNLAYRISGENAAGYTRGNAFNWSGEFFYEKSDNEKRLRVLPKVTASYEYADPNRLDGALYVLNTGRNFVFAGLGADVYIGRLLLGAQWAAPVHQAVTEDQLRCKSRFSVNAFWLF